MSEHTRGRHRSATRYSPVAELSTIVRSAGETGARASAVLAASGGLVATFALPAHAVGSSTGHTAVAGTAAAAPAADPVRAATTTRVAAAAPALVAPQAAAPVMTETVGIAGVTAVAKPKPKPKPKPEPVVAPEPAPVQQALAERSSTGTASRSAAPTPTPTPPPPPPPPPAPKAQSSSGVVNIARGLLGIPYVYGGSTPSGFDCSGFTMYVFGKAGVSLPRTAAQQQAAATPVSDPQPGDLVFFGSPAWHVGIYTGGGMMVDSGKPGEVTQERAVFSGVSGYGRF
ncbi:C40 family peptidase [Phycicoccus flavus]|uniref:C40 family peptidase n=1 Tax=Phycicoccus flavus TaxID=2502783 RepID=UPI000FEC20F9|nr:C40 family peptidase [Phycicoccus flavus]NHA67960.1 C40 family peptidase [Phycicoccus flavus]